MGAEDTSEIALQPLADLHRHLDGSLRRSTLEELAARHKRHVPRDLLFHPGMGLTEALAKFAFILDLLQEPQNVRRVAAEICEDAQADGVTTLEIRFAPQLHRGATVEVIVDSALTGIGGRAGLILCALYGESPSVLEHLVEVAGARTGVVGIDLAGGPAASHRYGLNEYAPAFLAAERMGLGRTVHASEGRSPEEIRTAVEKLHAQRLGHATTLLQDQRALELVLAHQVTIEACPTSNWHTGTIPGLSSHPLPLWQDAGVRVTVSPDNTLLSSVTAREEFERAASLPGMTPSKIKALIDHGHSAAFHRT